MTGVAGAQDAGEIERRLAGVAARDEKWRHVRVRGGWVQGVEEDEGGIE